jgi:hypothetical protein
MKCECYSFYGLMLFSIDPNMFDLYMLDPNMLDPNMLDPNMSNYFDNFLALSPWPISRDAEYVKWKIY